MSRHIVLTGATGYLGNTVLRVLNGSPDSHRVTATFYDKPEDSSRNIHFISYADLLHGGMDLTSVDFVCHLGVPRVRHDDPRLAASLTDLHLLLRKAASSGVRGFLFASSQAVYGKTPPIWHENSLPAPVTSWGWSKLAGEQLVAAHYGESSNLKGISLRILKLIGPGRGFRIDQGEWVHALIYAALHKREIFVSREFLCQQFDLMDVRDAASVIVKVIDRSPESWPEVLNIGLGTFFSGQQLVDAVSDFCRKNIIDLCNIE